MSNFEDKLSRLLLGLVVILVLMVALPGIAYATPPDNRPPDNRPPERDPINVETQTESEARADSNAEADAESSSTSIAGSDSSATGGTSTVTTRNESSSLVLTGARDTAECFTKVTIGAEGFGIGFSRKDKYCRKVRLIARQIELGNYAAAARLECTLPEWEEVYGKDSQECRDDLNGSPEPVSEVDHGDHVWLMADVTQDEYYERQQMVEDRFAQYENKVESLEQKAAADDDEIERLKREAAALRAKQKEEEARRAKVRELLKKEKDDGQ